MVRQRPHWLLAFTVPLSRSCPRHASARHRRTSPDLAAGSGPVSPHSEGGGEHGCGAGIRFNRLHGTGSPKWSPGPEADGEHYTSAWWPATRNRSFFCPPRRKRGRPSGCPEPGPVSFAHLEQDTVELGGVIAR